MIYQKYNTWKGYLPPSSNYHIVRRIQIDVANIGPSRIEDGDLRRGLQEIGRFRREQHQARHSAGPAPGVARRRRPVPRVATAGIDVRPCRLLLRPTEHRHLCHQHQRRKHVRAANGRQRRLRQPSWTRQGIGRRHHLPAQRPLRRARLDQDPGDLPLTDPDVVRPLHLAAHRHQRLDRLADSERRREREQGVATR